MARGLRFLLMAAALAWLSTACSKAADEQRSAADRRPAPGPASGDSGDTGETGPAAEVEEVIEIAGAEPQLTPNTVPVTPVTPSAVSVPWREVASPGEALEFIYVASGVVARSSAGIHTLDKQRNLVLRPELELPPGSLLGRWPDDVWLVEATRINGGGEGGPPRFGYRVLRLDGERRWVPQPVKREERWVGEPLAVRKGWHGGLLIREGSILTRIGSRKSAPKLGVRMAKTIVDIIESSSGRVSTISSRHIGMYVQGSCSNLKCVNESAKKLPFDNEWSFSIQVPRQRHSLSMVASVDDGGASTSYLLHFELGGWKLEPMSSPPSGLWASADGGLWVLVDAKLLYRTEHGDWYEVAPPHGAGNISAAMLGDASELWVTTTVAGKPRVFATAGIVAADE